jgi:NADH dehydrogenase FAD-containing subunit
MSANKSLKPFKYNDKGSMAIIGKIRLWLIYQKMHFKGFCMDNMVVYSPDFLDISPTELKPNG